MKTNRTGGSCALRRLTALLLTLVLLYTCSGTAWADEQQEPAPALDAYVIDGITYYNVNSPNFDKPAHYLRDLMGTASAELDACSIVDRWLEVGVGCIFGCKSAYKRTGEGVMQSLPGFPIQEAARGKRLRRGVLRLHRAQRALDAFP